jgi:polyhydroxybutyrate depolymerase
MRYSIPTFTTLFLAWAVSGAELLAERQWDLHGVKRSALLHIPKMAADQPTPVVFAFHGHGGTMANAARTFRIHELWPEAIVVYMQGLRTPGKLTDPEGKRSGWQNDIGEQSDRDLMFFDAVLATLQSEYAVDARRIYATGHSNGGGFTYLLWAERGAVLAAVAPSGSAAGRKYQRLTPKPALHVAGEKDPLVRYEWQDANMQAIKRINHCASDGRPWASAGSLVGTEFASSTGTPFISLIYPGGHKFPADAAPLIVKFFKQQTKPAESSSPPN